MENRLGRTKKITIRVPSQSLRGLKAVAEIDGTLADFVRGCINYVLTADDKHLPGYIQSEGLGGFPTIDDIEGWIALLGRCDN